MFYLAGIPIAMIAFIVWNNCFPDGELADLLSRKLVDDKFFIVVFLLMWPVTMTIMISQLITLVLFKAFDAIKKMWKI